MSSNKMIFFILLILLCILFFLSKQMKEGFSDFDDKIDIKALDDKEFKDNQGGIGIFKDNLASHEILDLHKLKNLKYGKLDNPVPITTLSTPLKLQQLQFLEKLKDISRVSEVQFKETKLTSLYPASLKQGQPYNVGKIDINDSNTLDIKKNSNEIMNRNYETNNKNNNSVAKTQTQKFTKMITDAQKNKT